MKRYMLFQGYNYYLSGGMEDFAKDSNDLEYLIKFAVKEDCDWWHIYCLKTESIASEKYKNLLSLKAEMKNETN